MHITRSKKLSFLCALLGLVGAPTARSADETWERVKKKSVGELKDIMKDLGIPFENSDSPMDENEIRSLAYDEDAVEQWLNLNPTEKYRVHAAEKQAKDRISEIKEMHEKKHPKDYSYVKDPERRALLDIIKKSGIEIDGVEQKPTDQLKKLEQLLNGGALPTK